MLERLLARRTRAALAFDWLRLRARCKRFFWRRVPSISRQLHLGCGARRVGGWLNVDVVGSDFDLDFAAPLPFPAERFQVVASQQVIEHLELETELRPLVAELNRVLAPWGEIWLACPDMGKVCAAYISDRGASLRADRETRWPCATPEHLPTQQIINVLFHQDGQHKNLFDFDLLRHLLEAEGFVEVQLRTERDFNRRFPEFPARGDDAVALYVSARRP